MARKTARILPLSALCMVTALGALIIHPASASEEMITVGTGAETNLSKAEDVNVLLRLGFSGVKFNNNDKDRWNVPVVVAHIHADFAIDPKGGRMPYFDVEFDPVTFGEFDRDQRIKGDYEGEGAEFHVVAVPVTVRRDIRIDQNLNLQIDAVSLQGWDPLESTCRHASLSIL